MEEMYEKDSNVRVTSINRKKKRQDLKKEKEKKKNQEKYQERR